jgi:hypothetical protein
VHAGPPSGNTTVPYKDSRLLPSHAPPVVTARFESLPQPPPRPYPASSSFSSFFFLFFARDERLSEPLEVIETARGTTVPISVRLYANNCRVVAFSQLKAFLRSAKSPNRAKVRDEAVSRSRLACGGIGDRDWPSLLISGFTLFYRHNVLQIIRALRKP